MNKTPFRRLREFLQPKLDPSAPRGHLNEREAATAHALLKVLAADAGFPAEACRAHLDERTRSTPGLLGAYRDGLALLDEKAGSLFARPFAELDPLDGDRALRQLLRPYRHRLGLPRWRRRLRLTGANFEALLAPRRRLGLRLFLVRDLLSLYYTRPEGWAVVGYDEFPGHVRAESEACQVIGFRVEGERIVLELSDGTFEPLQPDMLRMDRQDRLSVSTKSGRQQAVFSHDAHFAFCELLEETANGFQLRVGETVHEVLTGDVAS